MQVIHHEEASRLEQERTEFDKERQQEREKRRSLQNPPPTNEKLSREEMADRINRFMCVHPFPSSILFPSPLFSRLFHRPL